MKRTEINQHKERVGRAALALLWDLGPGLFLLAFFDHIWWLEGLRGENPSMLLDLALLVGFTFWARFLPLIFFGSSLGFTLARLRPEQGLLKRFIAAGTTFVDFLLVPLLPLQLVCLFWYRCSLAEFLSGPNLRVRPRGSKLLAFYAPRTLLGLGLVLTLGLSFGKIARAFDPARVIGLTEAPLVVSKSEADGTIYNSNRFRVSFQTNLRDSLGVRRVSIIPSFEVMRSERQKYFYPGIVFFDRTQRSFARLGLHKEIEYQHFMARARSFDPSFEKRYPRLARKFSGDWSEVKISGLAEAREFQDYLMEAFASDTSWGDILKAPGSSRAFASLLFDLTRELGLNEDFKVSRMSLSNESFIRLHPKGSSVFAGDVEYWLTTQGPKLRVYSLESPRGENKWRTDEVLPILFRHADWEFESDKPFPIGRHKETITAVSVVDLYTEENLSEEEKEEIARFIFYHFFELAHDALVLKQEELQTLISDTIERFLVIARHRNEKKVPLYSERFQKTLSDLNSSLKSKDHAYFGIK